MNPKKRSQPYDEALLTTDRRYKLYKAIEDRINIKYGLLFRMYYGETGNANYYQILIPKKLVLVNEVLWNLLREFGRHPGIAKTKITNRKKNNSTRTWHIKIGSGSCPMTNASKNYESTTDTCPPVQNPSEHITGPDDAMQMVLVLELPPSGG